MIAGATHQIASAAVGMARRGYCVDAVVVGAPSSIYRYIDMRVAGDGLKLRRGRVQAGTESGGDAGQHRAGFVEVRQVLRTDAAQFIDGIEVRLGGGAIEQDVASWPSPKVGVRSQPRKRRFGARLPQVVGDLRHGV